MEQSQLTIEVPKPILQTEAEIQRTIATYYKPCPATWDGNLDSLRKGMSVLWEGHKNTNTKSCNYSTKVEWFSGIFHGFTTSEKEYAIVS